MKVKWLTVIFLPFFAHCQSPEANNAQDRGGKTEQPLVNNSRHRESKTIQPPPANSQLFTANNSQLPASGNTNPANIGEVPLPSGYTRVTATNDSFTSWLRNIKIKKDPKVYLYNGRPKRNQDAQFAVLNIPVGTKDLQQCADAVMRMRAEYLYQYNRLSEISFADNNGKKYNCPSGADRKSFEHYLESVFAYCGTASLEKQLRPVPHFKEIQPGDVLIRGGYPGHAVMVMDVAVDSTGHKIYLIAQSYMPAQDIHLLRNPNDKNLNPWYSVDGDNSFIYSPEWTFTQHELRRW
jgi:hypothetical protein